MALVTRKSKAVVGGAVGVAGFGAMAETLMVYVTLDTAHSRGRGRGRGRRRGRGRQAAR